MSAVEELSASDLATLRDPRLARNGAIAGVASIVLAPVVVGFLAGAIGLHASRTHLRERIGWRGLAWFGAITSVVGAVSSAVAAIVWGVVLMTVMLQHSALRQAQSWRGLSTSPWTLVDVNGVAHTSDDSKGRVILLDCFAPSSPYCKATTNTLSRFSAAHPEIVALSWCADCDAEAARQFATECAAQTPICVGGQAMPTPFDLVAAKPTLIVIDGDGVIREVVLGRYDEAELKRLVESLQTR